MFKKLMPHCILMIIAFGISYVLYMRYFFSFGNIVFASTFCFGIYDFSPLVAIVLLTVLLYFLLSLLLFRRISKKFVLFLYGFYFILLFFLLFFKSVGVRGFSIIPFQFLMDFKGYGAFVVCMNMLMFVPLGFLLKFSAKNVWRVLLALFLVESIQFLFSLGIFDIDDILLNFSGYLLGALLIETKFSQHILTKIE